MRDANDGGEAVEAEDFELEITGTSRPAMGGVGTWVDGQVAGYRFQALAFADHADNPEFEVGGDSRISKLWVQRLSDRAEVFNWDRGADVPPADATVAAIVELLAAGLAEYVYNR